MSEPLQPLTPEEERFVEEYLIDFNGTAAYRRVHPGVTRRSASTLAARLLARVDILAAVDEGRAELRERSKASADKVIEALAWLAFYDPGAAADLSAEAELRLLPPRLIPPEVRAAITRMKSKRRTECRDDGTEVVTEEREYAFASKLEALDKLARHLGLFRDLPALEVLLGALPPDVAAAVRAALAAHLHVGGAGRGRESGDEPGPGPAED